MGGKMVATSSYYTFSPAINPTFMKLIFVRGVVSTMRSFWSL